MRSRPKGFTLIELFVVIAIIAILAAILVFARARDKARQAVCLLSLNRNEPLLTGGAPTGFQTRERRSTMADSKPILAAYVYDPQAKQQANEQGRKYWYEYI